MSPPDPVWVVYFGDPPPEGAGTARDLLGGKGASLAEMTRAGLAVPPGFTLTTACCEAYFELGRQWPEGLEAQVRAALARLEKDTGLTYGKGAPPLLLSVRSGAAHSMPGMMDTLLNCGLHPGLAGEAADAPRFWELLRQFVTMAAKVWHGAEPEEFAADGPPVPAVSHDDLRAWFEAYRRHTGEGFPTDPWEILVRCINAVFDSWNNERAVAYRDRNRIRGLRGTGVNVQAMFPSEVSGITFTQDPNALGADRMVIEASYGLGEAVVSGDVTPDRFLVSRRSGDIETVLGQKATAVSAWGEDAAKARDPDAPSLTEPQVRELADLCRKIEDHYGHPVDVEWGLHRGRFALLQARAIRGLDIARAVEPLRQAEIARLRAEAGDTRRVWITHNLGETLRFPTPLTWDIVWRFMSGDGGFGRMYQALGYQPSARVRKEGFLELIAGRIYADPDRLAALFWAGFPLIYDHDELAKDKALLDSAPRKFDPERTDHTFLRRLPGTLAAMIKASRLQKRGRARAKVRYEREIRPAFVAWVEAERRRDLTRLEPERLLGVLRDRIHKVLHEFAPESLLPGFFGGLAYDRLQARLVQLMGEEEGGPWARELTRGLDGDSTVEQDIRLHEVAEGECTLTEFLAEYGHRAVGEMELSAPRWREDPRFLEQSLARIRSHDGLHARESFRNNQAARVIAESKLPEALAAWGGSSLLEDIRADLELAQGLLPFRESGKHDLMLGYELIRGAIEALDTAFGLAGDIYFLTLDELSRFEAETETLKKTLAERKVTWQAAQRLDLPDVIDSRDLDRLGLPPELDLDADVLDGAAVAAGSATGTARVVHNPAEAGDLGADYVLVCPSTDPGWTPLFTGARALVVERGGVLSHGAIVARDFGIPAVVVPHATKLIPDGRPIRVDGQAGRVILLDDESVASPSAGVATHAKEVTSAEVAAPSADAATGEDAATRETRDA